MMTKIDPKKWEKVELLGTVSEHDEEWKIVDPDGVEATGLFSCGGLVEVFKD
jgi:hypothetical protein